MFKVSNSCNKRLIWLVSGKKELPVRAELFSRAMQYTGAGRPATTTSWARWEGRPATTATRQRGRSRTMCASGCAGGVHLMATRSGWARRVALAPLPGTGSAAKQRLLLQPPVCHDGIGVLTQSGQRNSDRKWWEKNPQDLRNRSN